MKDRIKQLRSAIGLTQNEFGLRIASTRDAVAAYERGVTIKEPIIKLICNEFNVNESWLKDGIGTMFVELSREEEISEYIGSLISKDDESVAFQMKFIKVLSKLNINDWQTIEKIAKNLANEKD